MFLTSLTNERFQFDLMPVLHQTSCVAFHGAIFNSMKCIKNHYKTFLCHLRYTSAFVGHLLLFGIGAVVLLPPSFCKGESKIYK